MPTEAHAGVRAVTYTFTGSVGVVTGAAGDLGGAVVTRLLAAGADVVALDRDERGLAAVREATRALPGRLITRTADVTDAASVRAAVDAADEFGDDVSIDLLFNNAGIEGRVDRIENLTADDLAPVWDVNVVGVVNVLAAVLPRMRAGGAVVNTASTAALAGAPGVGAYVASKHAVLGITRTAAAEAVERGIRINALCPGPIEGRMMASLDEQRADVLHAGAGSPRTYARAVDVAEVVLFLFSDAATLLTGQAITVAAS